MPPLSTALTMLPAWDTISLFTFISSNISGPKALSVIAANAGPRNANATDSIDRTVYTIILSDMSAPLTKYTMSDERPMTSAARARKVRRSRRVLSMMSPTKLLRTRSTTPRKMPATTTDVSPHPSPSRYISTYMPNPSPSSAMEKLVRRKAASVEIIVAKVMPLVGGLEAWPSPLTERCCSVTPPSRNSPTRRQHQRTEPDPDPHGGTTRIRSPAERSDHEDGHRTLLSTVPWSQGRFQTR